MYNRTHTLDPQWTPIMVNFRYYGLTLVTVFLIQSEVRFSRKMSSLNLLSHDPWDGQTTVMELSGRS